MRRATWFAFALVLMGNLHLPVAGGQDVPAHWSQWRGPLGTGEAPDANPPVVWSEQEHVRWKTSLPGKGHSTPVVWGDRIFVTTAVPFGEQLPPQPETAPGAHDNVPVTQHHKYVAICVSRRDGSILWKRVLHEDLPHEGGHYTASLASASPVTDGKRWFAYFGSRGLYCLDFDGKVLWEKNLGQMQSKHAHGEGSTPALHGDTLVVNWDHEGQSFVIALDKRTGKQLWKVLREEVTSWSSPIIVVHDGRPQVIVCGSNRVRGYDLATGEVIWACGGLSQNIVATPVAAEGMVYVGSSYEKRALLAIRLDGAKGDITETENVVWSRMRGTPYVPSPLLYQGSLYFLRHYQGILTRVVAKTGEEPINPMRLGGLRNIYASPVAASDRIYVTDLDGVTLVISHGDIPRALAMNRLDDSFSASVVPIENELILRGEKFLYCIKED